jgi:CBS domain-containing protein
METDIPIKEIMVREVVTGDQNLTVLDAAKLMRKQKVDSVVVLDHGTPVGIVTEGDIISEVVSKDVKASAVKLKDVMTYPLVIATPNDRLSVIAKRMAKERIRKMPVVEDSKLVGIVADVDILNVSSEMTSILSELLEMNLERESFEVEVESVSQGICEKCGSFSHYLVLKGGLSVCETCKDELELEGE